jgi:hypothetical protein
LPRMAMTTIREKTTVQKLSARLSHSLQQRMRW